MAKHSYKRSHEKFVNPYNFVPLGDSCNKSIDYIKIREKEGMLTGWIDCDILTMSPVFIPNTTNDDIFKKRTNGSDINSYEFFSYKDLTGKAPSNQGPIEPVIPGSEIRGMIRTAFEATTNSCMSSIDSNEVLFKRLSYPLTNNGGWGRLEKNNGKWKLHPCERYGVSFRNSSGDRSNLSQNMKSLKEGDECWIRPSGWYVKKIGGNKTIRLFKIVDAIQKSKPHKIDGWKFGYFHKGEMMPDEKGGDRRHHESVFVEKCSAEPIEINEETIINYRKNLELYANDKINQNISKDLHTGYKHINKKKLDGALVYYSKHQSNNGVHYYLSPAAIGRQVFYNSLKDIIGSYTPCSDIHRLCPACALFGFVSKKEAAQGRVRFSDAVYFDNLVDSSGPSFMKPMVIPELASPKPSATEFYLKRPSSKNKKNYAQKADVWNYDYAGTWKGYKLDDFENYIPVIHGRKFYWHGNGNVRNLETNPLKGEDISDRNVKIRPLNADNRFKFRIDFNSITRMELKQIIWVLTMGGSQNHGHKIGMGKPVGLGSISISVNRVNLRSVGIDSNTLNYTLDHDGDIIEECNSIGADPKKSHDLLSGGEKQISAFLSLTSLHSTFRDKVDYPRLCLESEIFLWFVANRVIQGKGKGTKPVIDQELRPPDNPVMHKIKD